jgi:YbbR domain-containing protein
VTLRSIVTTDRSAKIGSLAAAVILWLFAISGASRTAIFPGDIVIKLTNVPDKLSTTVSQATVRVRISAEQAIWRQLRSDSFVATIDLTGHPPGVSDSPVRVESLVPSVQVVEVVPSRVTVQLEPLTTRSVAVEVRTEGEPAAGFFASEAMSDPPTVLVHGTASRLDRLARVVTVVDVSNAAEARVVTVPLQVVDVAGHAVDTVTLDPSTVTVTQQLTRLAATKTVGVRVVTKGSAPSGGLVTVTEVIPSTVTVAGSEQRLAGLGSISTQPIDLVTLGDQRAIHVALDPPRGVTVTDATEAVVTLAVTEQEAVKSIAAKLDVVGLSPDRRITAVDPAAPLVTVRGPAAKVANLTGNDVVVTVDLSGSTAGERRFDLQPSQVKVPDGVTIQQLVTPSLLLKVE